MRWICMGLALAAGCSVREPDGGTLVGNPGEALARVAKTSGLVVEEVELASATLTAEDCEGSATGPTDVGVLGVDAGVALPDGAWCTLTFLFDDTSRFTGVGTDGGTFDITVAMPGLVLVADPAVDVTGEAWLLELGSADWITAEAIGLTNNGSVVITPRDPAHATLPRALGDGSALYADVDQDGVIGASERTDGPAMAGIDR